jgi:hypothetical protein
MAAAGARRRKRRSYRELFIDELKKLSKGEQKLVANEALRDALGWQYERYKRIKGDLVEERAIIVGRGRGGSVGLANAPGAARSKALQIFISYSHVDADLKGALVKHLEPLRRLNLIDQWHDGKIEAGDKWDEKIAEAIEKSDIILLLVSIDFINSRYCYDVELDLALERGRDGDAVVIPVIGRSCIWESMKFAHLQSLPADGKAIASWADRDQALTAVAEGIKRVAERLMDER